MLYGTLTIEKLLLFYCCLVSLTTAFRSPTSVLDQVVFGDVTSEAVHDLSGSGTILGSTNTLPLQYSQIVTYRQIGADPLHTQNQTIAGNQSTFIIDYPRSN